MNYKLRIKGKILIIFAFIFFGFFGLTKSSSAATYYVKNGGNDSLDGLSDATAWATISKVQSTVSSGDTVYFRSQDTWTSSSGQVLNATVAGVTYDGLTYGTGTRATLKATGTMNWTVVDLGASNITFKGFDVDMNNQITNGISISTLATSPISNITVDNCKVHDNYVPSGYYRYAVLVSGIAADGEIISNVTLTNNEIYNTGHEGLALYSPWVRNWSRTNGVTARNNIIHDTGKAGGWGDAVYIVNNTDNVTFEFNIVYNSGSNAITIGTSGDARPTCTEIGSPNGLTVRYNLIYNNPYGITLNSQCGMQGDGSIYSNLILNSIGTDIYIGGDDPTYTWGTSVFNFYNNTIYNTVNYVDSSSFSIGVGKFYMFYGSPTFTFKNNIVYTNSIGIDDRNDALTHSNNLFYQASGNPVVVDTTYSGAIPSATVTVSNDGTYTYFTKSGGIDWTTIINAEDRIKWSGFSSSALNDKLIYVRTVTANQIKVWLMGSYADSNTVTGEVWKPTTYNLADVKTWEPNAQNSDPTFTGGTLPTGFSGTYGTDMVPNTTYFAITSGNALNNGATLGSPYNGSINGAGLANPITRPQGVAYDIGAYEYVNAPPPDTTPPAAPTGVTIN